MRQKRPKNERIVLILSRKGTLSIPSTLNLPINSTPGVGIPLLRSENGCTRPGTKGSIVFEDTSKRTRGRLVLEKATRGQGLPENGVNVPSLLQYSTGNESISCKHRFFHVNYCCDTSYTSISDSIVPRMVRVMPSAKRLLVYLQVQTPSGLKL